MDLHLRGKSVLITGASKGIGAATAEAFAEEGCNVHLAARSTEAMQALADRLRTAHQVNVMVHTVDLRKSDDLRRLARETAGIDILINNAGVGRQSRGGCESSRHDTPLANNDSPVRPEFLSSVR